MIHLIGISGKMGSGKDTVAGIIQRLTGDDWRVMRFAGKLKQIASILTGIPVEKFEDQNFKASDLPECWDVFQYKFCPGGTGVLPVYDGEVNQRAMTVRELLQKLGTDCIRDRLHQNAWVNALFADYSSGQRWIVPDTRFANEYGAIRDRGGIVIRVERPGADTGSHPSETALDGFAFDYTIINNGDLCDLSIKVNHMLSKLGLYAKEGANRA